MRLIRRVLLIGAVIIAPFAAVLASHEAAPAAADSGCYVNFYTDINYSGYVTTFPCPPAGNQTYNWSNIGWPQYGAVSSMIVSMPGSVCAKPYDSVGYVFGPLYGPGGWTIADLRPYGWNDRITGLVINTGNYC